VSLRDLRKEFMVQIAVCGPADAEPEDLARAFEVGRLLAEEGATVLCGGYGGVMEAAARGAWEAGGTTVGVLSEGDAEGANPYLTVKMATGMDAVGAGARPAPGDSGGHAGRMAGPGRPGRARRGCPRNKGRRRSCAADPMGDTGVSGYIPS
jgi:hypothetical protein